MGDLAEMLGDFPSMGIQASATKLKLGSKKWGIRVFLPDLDCEAKEVTNAREGGKGQG
jgi:hypothetical protein